MPSPLGNVLRRNAVTDEVKSSHTTFWNKSRALCRATNNEGSTFSTEKVAKRSGGGKIQHASLPPPGPPSLSVMRIDIDGYRLRSPRRGGHPPPLERVSVLQRQGLRLVWFGRPGCTWDWHPWFLCWLWKWHCRFHTVLAQPAGPPQGGSPCRFQPPYSCGPRRFPKGDRKALWSRHSAKPYNSTRTKH